MTMDVCKVVCYMHIHDCINYVLMTERVVWQRAYWHFEQCRRRWLLPWSLLTSMASEHWIGNRDGRERGRESSFVPRRRCQATAAVCQTVLTIASLYSC